MVNILEIQEGVVRTDHILGDYKTELSPYGGAAVVTHATQKPREALVLLKRELFTFCLAELDEVSHPQGISWETLSVKCLRGDHEFS